MLKLWKAALLAAMLGLGTIAPASAGPSDATKLALKAVVLAHIQQMTDGNTYYFVEADSTRLRALSFLAMHPVIFERTDGTYALCADFEAPNGDKFLIDYYVRRLGDDLTVLAAVEGQRSLLMQMAERFNL